MLLSWPMLAVATAASSLTSASSFVVAPPLSRCGALARSSFGADVCSLLRSPSLPATCTSFTTLNHRESLTRWRSDGCCSMLSEVPGEGKFIRMGSAEDAQRFGPRCILAGGLSGDETLAARSILEEEDSGREGVTPLVLLTAEIADERVGDVLTDAAAISSRQEEEAGGKGLEGADSPSLTSPMILISGYTNTELRDFASRFRSATGVRAAFAKAVPKAMAKPAAVVCGEIAQDHADALAGKLHG